MVLCCRAYRMGYEQKMSALLLIESGIPLDATCDCNGEYDTEHTPAVRCKICGFCGQRIRGIWFNDHEGMCWMKAQVTKGFGVPKEML